ncbi:hypothetical protein ACHHYP_16740 [Achlya hypogyna]|uniref:Transmembrane protein 107 n=1 Tax=Achlya hypogyna TaxID=1202772 RepID=A0A1V9Y603_ACHHY|nr:hypothetical protein ACHHYP_16740 [Achlya hypogyna]
MEDLLVPSRFVLTMGHLLVTGLAWKSREHNVAAALAPVVNATTTTKASILATASVEAAWVFAMLGFAISFWGVVHGASAFHPTAAAVHVSLHFAGSLLVSRFVLEQLHYIYLWYVVALVHVPTVLVEIIFATRM